MTDQSEGLARPVQRTLVVALGTIALALAGYFGWGALERAREVRERAAAELAAADRSRAEEVRTESRQKRQVSDQARTAQLDARMERALTQLASNSPNLQCDAALQLGRSGSIAYRAPLVDLLATSTFSSVKGCAASALVTLGETDVPLTAYQAWSSGDDADLRRAALTGFGEIGSPAGDVGIPYLASALESQHWDTRYLAVESLSKLGSAAVPVLTRASADVDPRVRDRAVGVLKSRASER